MTFGSRHIPTALSRRRFLGALVTAALAAPLPGRAVEESAALEILVDKGGWGAASPSDIRIVLLAAAGEIWRHCPAQRMKPIRVYHRTDFPQTDFLHDLRGRIRIGLASEDTRWAQMAFQFSHEFGHALAQHSAAARRAWRTPRHANLWLEEALCETASLFVLRRLAAAWRSQPPHPQWRTYASAFADYAAERLARPEHQLPPERPFGEWFQSHEAALRENPGLRAKCVVIARQMLPLFEAEPAGWEAMCFLNLGARKQGKPLAQHFTEWEAASPAASQPFIRRLWALFVPT